MCDLTKGNWEVVETGKTYTGFNPKPFKYAPEIIACQPDTEDIDIGFICDATKSNVCKTCSISEGQILGNNDMFVSNNRKYDFVKCDNGQLILNTTKEPFMKPAPLMKPAPPTPCSIPHNCGQLNGTTACGTTITECNGCKACCFSLFTITQDGCDACFKTAAPVGCGPPTPAPTPAPPTPLTPPTPTPPSPPIS